LFPAFFLHSLTFIFGVLTFGDRRGSFAVHVFCMPRCTPSCPALPYCRTQDFSPPPRVSSVSFVHIIYFGFGPCVCQRFAPLCHARDIVCACSSSWACAAADPPFIPSSNAFLGDFQLYQRLPLCLLFLTDILISGTPHTAHGGAARPLRSGSSICPSPHSAHGGAARPLARALLLVLCAWWKDLAKSEKIWPSLAKSGQVWPSLAKSGQVWGCSSSCASAAARTLRVVGLLALLHERGCRWHLDLSEPALRIRWRCSPSCTSAAAELSFLRPMLLVGFYLCRLLHDIYCRLPHDIYTSFYVDSSMISLSICVDSSDIPSPFCLPPGAHSIIGIHILGNSALASCPRAPRDAPRDAQKLTVVQ
jgi:hypothetical protein